MLSSKLKGIEVVKAYDPTLPRVAGYAGELNQVWTNLVDNAVAAMGGTGHAHRADARRRRRRSSRSHDNGPGIPADDPRARLRAVLHHQAVGEGTGLGLDISWRIVVNRHHGDLRVRSRPGETAFTVRLPLVPPA